MQKHNAKLEEIKLIGMSAITNTALEMNSKTAQISLTIEKYLNHLNNNNFPEIINPNEMYCVYTNYSSDEKGDYTYFVGSRISPSINSGSKLETLIISPQSYTKFSIIQGKMPDACINAWKEIWQMSESDLGGQRSFIADFEVYNIIDKNDRTNFDIYIGIN